MNAINDLLKITLWQSWEENPKGLTQNGRQDCIRPSFLKHSGHLNGNILYPFYTDVNKFTRCKSAENEALHA